MREGPPQKARPLAALNASPLQMRLHLLECALTDNAPYRGRCLGSASPDTVEAVAVRVEPEREPARAGRSGPCSAHFVLRAELAVDSKRTRVANNGRVRLRALHLADERRRPSGAHHVPGSSGSNRRRRQNFVADERPVCSASVITPRAVEAVAVRAYVDGKPARAAGAVPFSVDPLIRRELAGEARSVFGVGSHDATTGLLQRDGGSGASVCSGLLYRPSPRDVRHLLGQTGGNRRRNQRQSAAD